MDYWILILFYPGAPEGYVGDPNIGHTITGSPTGNNFFSVTGPGIGLGEGAGDTVSTDLFTIAGKIAGPAPAFQDLGSRLSSDM